MLVISFIFLVALGLTLFVRYHFSYFKYSKERRRADNNGVLPTYPAYIPYIGNSLYFAFQTANFVRRATSYNGNLTSTAISIIGSKLYIFQDRDAIVNFMKHPELSSPMSIYVFALRHFFGMPTKAVDVYVADDSGPHAKPFSGTKVDFRIDYILHRSFIRAWTGPRLADIAGRFRIALQSRLGRLDMDETSWTEIPDLFQFLLHPISASITEVVFGPALLHDNPDFLDDLWSYDDSLPWMARAIPSFILPRPYRLRRKLLTHLKAWQSQARRGFHESRIEKDGWDPCWGSALVRDLQNLFTESGTLDEDALASHHLGLMFTANFNLVPSTIVTALHIIQDRTLVQRVRDEIESNFPKFPSQDQSIDPSKLMQLPLLSSIYAESLRLHVKVFFFASSPHSDTMVGKWQLPRGSTGVVNTDGPHTKERVWNTKDGTRPLESFWSDRFLVDPLDPTSGPIHPQLNTQTRNSQEQRKPSSSAPYYSTAGLEGIWLPYGGGSAICPGRFLAKYVIMYTCAVLLYEFNFEPREVDINKLDYSRYGLGIVRPKLPISALMKRSTRKLRS